MFLGLVICEGWLIGVSWVDISSRGWERILSPRQHSCVSLSLTGVDQIGCPLGRCSGQR